MERKGKKKAINSVAAVISVLPKKKLIKLQRNLVIRNRPEWKYVGSMFSSNYETNQLYFELSDFDDLIELPFENTVVNGPKKGELNLKRLYKDYMKFPSVEKRNSGHDVYKIETNGVF